MSRKRNRKRIAALMLATTFVLSSCSSKQAVQYRQGRELFASGNYADARIAFASIPEYKNSRDYIAYIDAWEKAQQGAFLEASEAFSSLGAFLDSQEEARDYFEKQTASQYAQSQSLIRRGEYQEAIDLLENISSYEEAPKYIAYAQALLLEQNGDLEEAAAALSKLDDFLGSDFLAQQLLEQNTEQHYLDAVELVESEKYESAHELLTSLGEYKDALRYDTYCKAMLAYTDGDYLTATRLFSELGLFLDSQRMLKKGQEAYSTALHQTLETALSQGNYASARTVLDDIEAVSEVPLSSDDTLSSVYIRALEASDQQSFDEAITLWISLGDFRDSEDQLADIRYKKALSLFTSGSLTEAKQLFLETPIKDSAQYISYIDACLYEEQADYASAAEAFSAVSDFLDSKARAQANARSAQERMYDEAVSAFREGDKATALKIFRSIPEYTDVNKYLTYLEGEALAEAEDYAQAAQIFSSLEDFADSPALADTYALLSSDAYFQKGLAFFAEGELDRAAEAFTASAHYAQSDSYLTYIKGLSLEEEHPEEAIQLFGSLGTFLDSSERLAHLQQLARDGQYDAAIALFESGEYLQAKSLFTSLVGEYDAKEYVSYLSAMELEQEGEASSALRLYLSLGNFLDSSKRAEACEQVVRASEYDRACGLLALGKTEAAEAIFASLGSYEDARDYLTYISAKRNMGEGNTDEAYALFVSLGSFLDAHSYVDEITESANAQAYAHAMDLLALGHFTQAYDAFLALSPYASSDDYAVYAQAKSLEAEGKSDEAQSMYASLQHPFLDSASQVVALTEKKLGEAYASGKTALEEGNLPLAENIFTETFGYEDSARYLSYISARKYAEDGNFALASASFETLDDFLDSAAQKASCDASLRAYAVASAKSALSSGDLDQASAWLTFDEESTESEQLRTYIEAMRLFEQKNFDGAMIRFETIVQEYPEAQIYLDSCRESILANNYEKALVLFHTGNTEEASTYFAKLGDYQDTQQYVLYMNAKNALSLGDYDTAYTLFSELGEFEDAREQAENTALLHTKSLYANAVNDVENRRFEEARILFEALGDYEDTAKYLTYLAAREAEANGNYTTAYMAYDTLSLGMLDSIDRAKNCREALRSELYDRLVNAFGQENTEAADQLIAQLAAYADVSSAQQYNAAMKLQKEQSYLAARDGYLSVPDFLDSMERASACDAEYQKALYTSAVTSVSENRLSDAQETFGQLDVSYEDTGRYMEYITARKLEDNRDFAHAAKAYLALGRFLDSSDRAANMEEKERYETYLTAAKMVGHGQLSEAKECFALLGAYLDAPSYLQYIDARTLESMGLTQETMTAYEQLGDFLDSSMRFARAKDTVVRATYEKGVRFYLLGNYDAAQECFDCIPDEGDAHVYLSCLESIDLMSRDEIDEAINILMDLSGDANSADLLIYAQARQAESNGEFEKAYTLYSNVPSLLDSVHRLLTLKDKELAASLDEARLAWEQPLRPSDEEMIARYTAILDSSSQENVMRAVYEHLLEMESIGENVLPMYQLLASRGSQDAADHLLRIAEDKLSQGLAQEALDVLSWDKDISSFEQTSLADACYLAIGKTAEDNHDLMQAYEAFIRMSNGAYAAAINARYLSALDEMIRGEYEKAHESFAALYNYLDSEERAKESLYRQALLLSSQGYPVDSSALFASLGLYLDSPQQAKDVLYQEARRLEAMGEAEEASELYRSLGEYLDSPSRASLSYVTRAEMALSTGDWEDALSSFAKAGMEDQGRETVQAAQYAAAENQLLLENYASASDLFSMAGDYADAQSRVQDTILTRGDSLMEAGDYAGALAQYATAYPSEEKTERIQAAYYGYALSREQEGDFSAAREAYIQAGNYEDALERSLTIAQREGDILLSGKAYVLAAEKYLEIGLEDVRAQCMEKALACAESAEDDHAALQILGLMEIGDIHSHETVMFHKAEIYVRMGDYDLASRAYLESTAPEKADEPYRMLAEQAIADGSYSQARDAYRHMQDEEETTAGLARIALLEAEELMERNDYAQSYVLLCSVNMLDRANEVYIRQGDSLFAKGQYDEAIEAYLRAENSDTASVRIMQVRLAQGRSAYSNQAYDDAIFYYMQAGESEEANKEFEITCTVAAQEAFAKEEYEKSAAYAMLAGKESEAEKAYYYLAQAALAAQAWDEAHDAFLLAGSYSDAAARVAEPYLTAGDIQLTLRAFDEAISWYQKAGSEGEESIRKSHYLKAEEALTRQAWEEAHLDFIAAGDYRDAAERIYEPYLLQGQLLMAEGKYDDAISAFALADSQEDIALAHYLHAEALLSEQRWEEANREFYLAGDTDDAAKRIHEPFLRAGDILLHAEAFDQAIAMYARAENDGIASIQHAQYCKAEYLLSIGDYEAASVTFARAGDYLNARDRIAEPYLVQGAKASAEGRYYEAYTAYMIAGDEQEAFCNLYSHAEQLLRDGQWDAASEAFYACGSYKDAQERIHEPYITAGDQWLLQDEYEKAILMYEKAGEAGRSGIQRVHYVHAQDYASRKAWDLALEEYALADGYEDTADRVSHIYIAQGDEQLEQEAYSQAMMLYEKAGEAAVEKILALHYAWGENALHQKVYALAREHFKLAGIYSDASVRINETFYCEGTVLLTQGRYLAAAQAFSDAADYLDSKQKESEAYYAYAEEKYAQEAYTEAADYFTLAGTYNDAPIKVQDCMYQNGLRAMQGHDMENAYRLLASARSYPPAASLLDTYDFKEMAARFASRKAAFLPGRMVVLGNYVQYSSSQGKEPVEWQVLYREGNRALLTTRFILAAMPFGQSADYAGSDIRTFLNQTFSNDCFDALLSSALIPQVDLDNDRVFLLSKEETELYLNNGKWMYENRASARAWARQQGVTVYGEHHVGAYW